MNSKIFYFICIFSFFLCPVFGQDISLHEQFNGRFNFTFIGNTLNTIENNSIFGEPSPPCTILTSSSAVIALNSGDVVEKAYLYWAGSGTGDFDIKLNGQNLSAERTFSIMNSAGLPCFGAFNDITTIVQTTGNGTYTFSELDLTSIINPYCPNGGNFGGWAIVIIYGNPALPINQINIYDGMQGVPNVINITLNSLNVIDNEDAKIGFLAWEGDKNISVNESLTINGSVLENLPLNPANNAFNGTNTFTGSDQLFNMDLDVYNIQNNISIGDTSAEIKLTSGQDFVMINCIVTKLNSQLPDASISIDNIARQCNTRQVIIDYTVYNTNGTAILESGVPIAIYADGIFIQSTQTLSSIAINGSESNAISLIIPAEISTGFQLTFVVDDQGTGHGIIIEANENNNEDSATIIFKSSTPLPILKPLISCNRGSTKGNFDFSSYENLVMGSPSDIVTFYTSVADLQNNTNAISDTNNYNALATPAIIYVKVDTGNCFLTTEFILDTKNCPPIVYNYVSANNDNANDLLFIDGLRDVFVNFKLSIYNRWGRLIWIGNNSLPDWDGHANKGMLIDDSAIPDGTYYYVLELNDPEYPQPLVGYLYMTR